MPRAAEGRPISRAVVRRRGRLGLWKYRLLSFLAVLGPGFVTANVDNDPGGILTYSQAGAKFGYALLWTLVPTTIALIVVQEMAARMGAVTGKGLSDLIREEFGLRATFFTMLVLGVADFGNIVAEFAGLASGMGIFGISKYVVVPVGAMLVWMVIVRGSYKPVERVLILFSLIYFAYPFSAFLAHPDWKRALHDTLVPQFSADPDYLLMIVGLIGTTITPWMQFYLQASVVEKGIDQEALPAHALGCNPRLHRDRRDRFLHRRGLRRHDSCQRKPRYYRRRPGGPRATPVRGTVCVSSVCGGPGERFPALGGDSAARDRLQHLRRDGIRVRNRPALFRSSHLLLAVYRIDRLRRGSGADSQIAPVEIHPVFAGGERNSAAVRAHLHAGAGQPAARDG